MNLIFGLEPRYPMPDNWTPLEAVVIVKCLDEDGDVGLHLTSTHGLNSWERVGMLTAATTIKTTTTLADRKIYNTKWQHVSRGYLKAHPVCERLDCDEPATDVHHIDGAGPSGPQGHDWTNLKALCTPHHSETTAAALGYATASKRAVPKHPGLINN